ncbi:hypothetical protein H6787_00650 [Candidatus Nomurabacteria bacterium]|nr:hypothetical protein [Candidatus Nomurabacteria bacterium]
MDEEVNINQEAFQPSNRHGYLQPVVVISTVVFLVATTFIVWKTNGLLNWQLNIDDEKTVSLAEQFFIENYEGQFDDETKAEVMAILEKRVAENGDPSIPTIEEQARFEEFAKKDIREMDIASDPEVQEMIEKRVAENGDPSIPTIEENAEWERLVEELKLETGIEFSVATETEEEVE